MSRIDGPMHIVPYGQLPCTWDQRAIVEVKCRQGLRKQPCTYPRSCYPFSAGLVSTPWSFFVSHHRVIHPHCYSHPHLQLSNPYLTYPPIHRLHPFPSLPYVHPYIVVPVHYKRANQCYPGAWSVLLFIPANPLARRPSFNGPPRLTSRPDYFRLPATCLTVLTVHTVACQSHSRHNDAIVGDRSAAPTASLNARSPLGPFCKWMLCTSCPATGQHHHQPRGRRSSHSAADDSGLCTGYVRGA